MTDQPLPPKVFISYSWSSPDHEAQVLAIASQIMESGIDVVLDKWNLKEGHDAIAFMESMVTDSSINKVIIISDKTYAEKADGRSGGVGTETQIISSEVYGKITQEKFILLATERDNNGDLCVPTYYKSRIYVDLSDPAAYAENFEKLIRAIYNKPLYAKPKIGTAPSYILEDHPVTMATSSLHNRAMQLLKDGKPNAEGALREFLEKFSQELEKFRIQNSDDEFDEKVISSIDNFKPYRNQYIQTIINLSLYACPNNFIGDVPTIIHRFFETMIPYFYAPEGTPSYSDRDFDNFKFIIHELFLYTIAIFLEYEKYNWVKSILEREFFVTHHHKDDEMVSFLVIRNHMHSLDHRNQRLSLKRLSLRADLLEQRSHTSGIAFRYLMQADFILWIRNEILSSSYQSWWPETLLYVHRFNRAFEIFARASSKAYFEKIKGILAIHKPEDLDDLLQSYQDRRRPLPRWHFESFNPSALLGRKTLATKP